MSISSLHHISITAGQQVIDDVLLFYTEVLGLTEGFRPDFGVAGHWLYKDKHPLVHLLVLDNQPGNNGYFDHVAFQCTGLQEMIKKLQSCDLEFSLMEIAQLNQTQIFITDPAGIKVELNFKSESFPTS